MQIVNLFYELAREHKRVKGFGYGRAGDKGAGNEVHPLTWVDDPILGGKNNQTLRYTVNVDILGIPDDDADVVAIQADALNVGLSYAEQITKRRAVTGISIEGYTFVTLRQYYDNNAAGVRMTYTVLQAIPVDLCAEDYDPDKQFTKAQPLPTFKTDTPDGCAVFSEKNGLPNFKLG